MIKVLNVTKIMKQHKILHIDSNHPSLWDGLEQLGFTNEADYKNSKAEIEAKIENYSGIVIRSRFSIDAGFLEKAKNLKFIARVGAGLENIDTEAAAKQNIALIAAPEGNRNAVGEHALGMLLSLFNNLKKAHLEVKNGQWNREANRGNELDGKTVGIIGYGNMGKAFAKKLRGFDVTVLCYDILENVGDHNATQVPLEQLQAESDVLSLHTPFTPLTHNMVNAAFIHAFKKPFWLINTARGKSVVTADLVEALKNGKILGAGLDVLEYEKASFEHFFKDNNTPAEFNYLTQADNVLLSPHVAGWTYESNIKLAETIVKKIAVLFNLQKEVAATEPKVTGLGGFFFKAENPKELKKWYTETLGLPTDDYGYTFWWHHKNGTPGSTQWSIFDQETDYLEPSTKPYMQNFRVQNLKKLLEKLSHKGVTKVGDLQTYEYGSFAWVLDPEGNKIELWEPIDSAFL